CPRISTRSPAHPARGSRARESLAGPAEVTEREDKGQNRHTRVSVPSAGPARGLSWHTSLLARAQHGRVSGWPRVNHGRAAASLYRLGLGLSNRSLGWVAALPAAFVRLSAGLRPTRIQSRCGTSRCRARSRTIGEALIAASTGQRGSTL